MTMRGVDWAIQFEKKVQKLLGEDGEVFTVDPNGGADYISSQEAIDACVAGRGDVIIRKKGGEEVTATVDFDKSDISYIAEGCGVAGYAKGELFSIYSAAAHVDLPVAQITERCYIEGIAFVSRDSRSDYYNGAALLIGGEADAGPFGVHLYECRFPKWGLDNSGGIALEGAADTVIEKCSFEGVGSNFDYGIYGQGALENLTILDCIFRDCTYGVELGSMAGGGPDFLLKRCDFIGSKILSAGSTAPGLIAECNVGLATDTGSYSGTVNALNAYGIQMCDVHYAE